MVYSDQSYSYRRYWFPHRLKVLGFSAHDTLLTTLDTLKAALTEFVRLPQGLRNNPQPARPLIYSVINNLIELFELSAPAADIPQGTHVSSLNMDIIKLIRHASFDTNPTASRFQ